MSIKNLDLTRVSHGAFSSNCLRAFELLRMSQSEISFLIRKRSRIHNTTRFIIEKKLLYAAFRQIQSGNLIACKGICR